MFRALTFFALTATPALACPQYDTVVAAVQSDDKTSAEVLYDEIVFSAACDDAIREWVGDYLARETFLTAQEADNPDTQRALLEQALGYETHWRTYAALGQLDWDAGAYADAASQLQLALNELAEGDQSHPAEEAEIAEVYELATAALALADTTVTLPKTRSGSTGGILTTTFRGFQVEEVALPITFEYNSTTFDVRGSDYAAVLAEHLALTSPAVVTLGGHTDPVGSEAFNLDLSLARAEALSAYLRDAGFSGEISVLGHGESQLPTPPPGIAPGSEEHHRIARRVAFSLQ
ncbi:MAG: OmpA family protein [Pseudomonadota bacterium]